jgi:hypothetical protein
VVVGGRDVAVVGGCDVAVVGGTVAVGGVVGGAVIGARVMTGGPVVAVGLVDVLVALVVVLVGLIVVVLLIAVVLLWLIVVRLVSAFVKPLPKSWFAIVPAARPPSTASTMTRTATIDQARLRAITPVRGCYRQ